MISEVNPTKPDCRRLSRFALKGGLVSAGWSVFLLLAGLFLPVSALAADRPFSADFTIYSVDGTQVLGHSRYSLKLEGDNELLKGENHYLDGSYDIEVNKLQSRPDGFPALLEFDHSFYRADGSLQISGRANLRSGDASCIDQDSDKSQKQEKVLSFPDHTYAGASLLIPIQHALRARSDGPVTMSAFECAPDPKVITVVADISDRNDRWSFYPGDLARVTAEPDLGWWDLVVAPFLPKVRAWFDPSSRWDYVGGLIHRYLSRGPQVLLVKTPKSDKDKILDALSEAPNQAIQ
jgi:hypothetical protein